VFVTEGAAAAATLIGTTTVGELEFALIVAELVQETMVPPAVLVLPEAVQVHPLVVHPVPPLAVRMVRPAGNVSVKA
jgi:hypothetical protein